MIESKPYFSLQTDIKATTSGGVSSCPAHTDDADLLFFFSPIKRNSGGTQNVTAHNHKWIYYSKWRCKPSPYHGGERFTLTTNISSSYTKSTSITPKSGLTESQTAEPHSRTKHLSAQPLGTRQYKETTTSLVIMRAENSQKNAPSQAFLAQGHICF